MPITIDEYKAEWLWKRVNYENFWWKVDYQCVEFVKHFVQLVHWVKLWSFSGSALKWRTSWSPFLWLPYIRVRYVKWAFPPRGAVIFFDKTAKNPYGHVAIAGESSSDVLYVMEQNWWAGTGTWIGTDAIRVSRKRYEWDPVWNVLGWYVLYVIF